MEFARMLVVKCIGAFAFAVAMYSRVCIDLMDVF
jgi:hypothetical protein